MPKPAWDRWYTCRRWRKLRLRIIQRDGFTCQMCGRVDVPSNLVADHRQPHRGDATLFWDESNIQTLCANPCHNLVKQSLEKGGSKQAPPIIGADGWPEK